MRGRVCTQGRYMTGIKTYSAQIIEHIKKSLLRGDLMPGDKVNEVHLASALSISRAPVREALQMLVKEGLIVSIPQRGKFIKALSAKEIRDSYFIGGVLEGAAVSSSVSYLSERDFEALESLVASMAELHADSPSYAEDFARLDVAFHEKLLSKAENQLIKEHSRNVCQRMSKFLLFRHWPGTFSHKEVVERHKKVLNAVHSKAPQHIEKVIRAHYDELGERMSRFGFDMSNES